MYKVCRQTIICLRDNRKRGLFTSHMVAFILLIIQQNVQLLKHELTAVVLFWKRGREKVLIFLILQFSLVQSKWIMWWSWLLEWMPMDIVSLLCHLKGGAKLKL